jgi:flagellar protein FliO/FliZ
MSNASTFALFARLIVSMAVVIGLMLALAHFAKRRGLAPGPRGGGSNVQVEVLARRSLARGSSVAVVRTAGKALVLGVTEQRVTKLAEADAEDFDIELVTTPEAQRTVLQPAQRGPSWKAMLEQLREKTVRH